jgi:hypothetical protein
MSQREGLNVSRLAVYAFGVIILSLGIVLTYFSVKAEVGVVSPRMFAPVGVVMMVLGGILLVSREG